MSIVESAQRRYAAKAFDADKPLSDKQVEQLTDVLRLSPSAINIQAWHFVVCRSEAAKARLAKCCYGPFEYNAQKIKDAGLVVLLCAKNDVTRAQVERVLDQEFADGRFATQTQKDERMALMGGYVDKLNEQPSAQVQAWLDKQVYIALGNVLLAAVDLGMDSVAIEGFDKDMANAEFELPASGYHAAVMAAFGYHSEDDFNAKLPKSRLTKAELFTVL